MSDIIIRNAEATLRDYDQLNTLFRECFGDMAGNNGALEPIEGRYVVAEHNKKIVAVSGIIPPEKSEFNGYEVSWTCCSEEYRGKHLITQILDICIAELPNDSIDLYCDCWKIQDNEKANLHYVMEHIGAEKVINNRIGRKHPYNSDCNGCPHEFIDCYCFGDLYRLERN